MTMQRKWKKRKKWKRSHPLDPREEERRERLLERTRSPRRRRKSPKSLLLKSQGLKVIQQEAEEIQVKQFLLMLTVITKLTLEREERRRRHLLPRLKNHLQKSWKNLVWKTLTMSILKMTSMN